MTVNLKISLIRSYKYFVIFLVVVSYCLFSQLFFNPFNVRFGGITEKMNPYNPMVFFTTSYVFILKDNSEYLLSFKDFYPEYFPFYIRGSFKYFYFRYPKLENDIAKAMCRYSDEKLNISPTALLVKIESTTGIKVKRYSCL